MMVTQKKKQEDQLQQQPQQATAPSSTPTTQTNAILNYSAVRQKQQFLSLFNNILCFDQNEVYTNLLQSLHLSPSMKNQVLTRLALYKSQYVRDMNDMIDVVNSVSTPLNAMNLVIEQLRYANDCITRQQEVQKQQQQQQKIIQQKNKNINKFQQHEDKQQQQKPVAILPFHIYTHSMTGNNLAAANTITPELLSPSIANNILSSERQRHFNDLIHDTTPDHLNPDDNNTTTTPNNNDTLTTSTSIKKMTPVQLSNLLGAEFNKSFEAKKSLTMQSIFQIKKNF